MSYTRRGGFGGYWGGYLPQPSSELDVYGQYHSVNNFYGLPAFPPFPETLMTDSGSSHGHESVGSSHEEVKSPPSTPERVSHCIEPLFGS